MNRDLIKKSIGQTSRNFFRVIPMLIGIFLLLALFSTVVPKHLYAEVFTNIPIIDGLIGAVLGSISAGNPITSYIIGCELLKQGVNLVAVTAFMLSWVTVGLIQLPAEALMLGRRFAIIRNAVNFVLAIVIALLTTLTLGLI